MGDVLTEGVLGYPPRERELGIVSLAIPILYEGQRGLSAQRRHGTTSRRSTSSPTASSKTV
jgi:hypothetical protein